jgi:signal recognition particle subunit SEC65
LITRPPRGTAGGTAMKRKQRKRLARQLAAINATLEELADAVREVALALSERPAPEPDQPTDAPRLQ